MNLLQFPNSKKNSFCRNYIRKYCIHQRLSRDIHHSSTITHSLAEAVKFKKGHQSQTPCFNCCKKCLFLNYFVLIKKCWTISWSLSLRSQNFKFWSSCLLWRQVTSKLAPPFFSKLHQIKAFIAASIWGIILLWCLCLNLTLFQQGIVTWYTVAVIKLTPA